MNDHLETWQRSGRSTTTCRPAALQAVWLQQRLGTGCRSGRHGGVPCWSLQPSCNAKASPRLAARRCSQFLPPLGLCRLLPKWGRNYSPVFPLVPLRPPWLCRGTSITYTRGQGASVRLKGKYKEEKGPAGCRHERRAERCSTQATDGLFVCFCHL